MNTSSIRTTINAEREARGIVNRSSPVPLHHQIRQLLLEQIESGELGPCQLVPPEGAYAEELGVSLAPVRQAILGLVRDGYLTRERGRGTFVNPQKRIEEVNTLWSFSDRMRSEERPFEMRVIVQGVVSAPEDVIEALHLDSTKVFELRRLALENSQPIALLTSYLDYQSFPGLLKADFRTASLYRTMMDLYCVEMSRASNIIEVARCNEEQAHLLGVAEGASALHVYHTTFDQRDRPVEVSHVLYQADRVRLSLESHKLGDGIIHGETDRNEKATR